MDMLPKVQFTIKSHNASNPIIKFAVMDTSRVVFSGIEVGEYVKVQVRLHSPSDPNAKLRIESYLSEEEIEISESDGDVTIMAGENSADMLVPGQYPIQVHCNDRIFYSFYNITSNNFSNEALLNLRQYLENILNGLSYDLVKQRMGMAAVVPELNPTLLQLFQFINKNKNLIRRNIELIAIDPITKLDAEYRITNKSTNPDSKSFRWQAQKGSLKSYSLNSPTEYYEKHSKVNVITPENQWVRFILNHFLQSIRRLVVNFQKEILVVSNKTYKQKERLIQNQKQIDVCSNSFGYFKTLISLQNERKRINNRLDELKNEENVYTRYKQQLRETMYIFNKLDGLWINSLSIRKPKKVTNKLLKDYRYRKLYTLYKEFQKLETKHVDSEIPGIQFRRTWQLFEYYNVGIIIDIFRENGYKWTNGWLASKDNPHLHIGTLPPDTKLKFERPNSDHYIELAYDTELESVPSNFSGYFNSHGRRPDIRITIYDKKGRLYSEKAGLIVESKCRHHRYLINEKIEPDVKAQLKDFKNLEYFEANDFEKGNPVKTPVKQVIVLYPKQNGKKPVISDHIYGEAMMYIQLEPNDYTQDEKPFGYLELKDQIDNFLSQVEEASIYA